MLHGDSGLIDLPDRLEEVQFPLSRIPMVAQSGHTIHRGYAARIAIERCVLPQSDDSIGVPSVRALQPHQTLQVCTLDDGLHGIEESFVEVLGLVRKLAVGVNLVARLLVALRTRRRSPGSSGPLG